MGNPHLLTTASGRNGFSLECDDQKEAGQDLAFTETSADPYEESFELLSEECHFELTEL